MNQIMFKAPALYLASMQLMARSGEPAGQVSIDLLVPMVIYVLVGGLVALALAYKFQPEHRLVGFLLAFWILGEGILNTSPFTISLGRGAGFEIQPTRLLFLLFGCILLLNWRMSTDNQGQGKPFLYERIFLVSLIAFLAVLIWHYATSTLTAKDVMLLLSEWLTFVCFYLVSRNFYDVGLVRVVLAAIILVGVASSAVSVIQFAFDPGFLRVGAARAAFSGIVRSNGVFQDEYAQSYFLILGLIIALTAVRGRIAHSSLVIVMLVGIFMTFYRNGWIATLISLFILSMSGTHTRLWRLTAWILVGIASVVMIGFVGIENIFQSSDLVYQRVMADTMTGRMNLYQVAIQRIQSTWLTGVGSVRSNTYFLDMILSGTPEFASGEIGGIHNLFLGMAYLYGVPTTLLYSGFLFSMTICFWRRGRGQYLSYIAAMLGIVFLVSNLTNAFYPETDVSLLLALLSGLAAGAECQKSGFPDDADIFAEVDEYADEADLDECADEN